MYKDKEAQKASDRERARRYRQRKGVTENSGITPENVTPRITPGALINTTSARAICMALDKPMPAGGSAQKGDKLSDHVRWGINGPTITQVGEILKNE